MRNPFKALTVRCLQCGMVILSDAESHTQHTKERHSIDAIRAVVPERTSTRTTPEIVRDVETRLRDFIVIPSDKVQPAHGESCRCSECFDKQLDRIINGQGTTWGTPNGQISVDAEN